VLFNAYTVRTTDDQILRQGGILSYADDVLVYRQDRDKERITAELQNELDALANCVGRSQTDKSYNNIVFFE
jgi:hypothetical protein